MPPPSKISKDMILNAVLKITRENGFAAVNARSIAGGLQCSTRPIFTCYENMDALKSEFLAFAYKYFEHYVADYRHSAGVTSALLPPLSYIGFAREEPHLFELLFIKDMALEMAESKDFYKEEDNEKRAAAFSKAIGVEAARAKAIFLDLFLYSHGIAVLTATKKMALDEKSAEKMLRSALSAFLRQEDPEEDFSLGDDVPLKGARRTVWKRTDT